MQLVSMELEGLRIRLAWDFFLALLFSGVPVCGLNFDSRLVRFRLVKGWKGSITKG